MLRNKILVVDGQGGGLGKAIIERLKGANPKCVVTAIGTNAAATANMLKASPNFSATGESAVYYNAPKADYIIGSIGIGSAGALMGEISPKIATAIGESPATKIFIPMNKCNLKVMGVSEQPMSKYIEQAVAEVFKDMDNIQII